MSNGSARRKKRNLHPAAPVQAKARPHFKKAWVIATAMGGILFTTLLNAPTILENIRKLPASIAQTRAQYLSWLHDDSEWTGKWTSFPEGIADMEDMHLSNVDMQITILSTQGKIEGTIATKKICKAIPLFDFVLLKGQVSGHAAQVAAWDIVHGHKIEFAKLRLDRDGDIMTVTPLDGTTDWFPTQARLGRHPDDGDPKPQSGFCLEESKAFMEQVIKQGGLKIRTDTAYK